MERRQVGATCLLAFFVCFNYYLLRVVKDAVVLTAGPSGASVIPFLKLWGVLPTLLVVSIGMSFCLRKVGHAGLTAIALVGFAIFFVAFGLWIYPRVDPPQCGPLLQVIVCWRLSIFYIVCELWKVVGLTVIFWGFVSLHTSADVAPRRFALYLVCGSLSALVAAPLATSIVSHTPDWQSATQWLLLLASAICLLSLMIYFQLPRTKRSAKSKKTSSNLKAVLNSGVLPWIGVMVIAEYVALQVVEMMWKESLVRAYPNPAAYCAYSARVVLWTGVAGLATTLVAPYLLKRWAWRTSALFTPCVALLLSAAFFILVGPEGALALAVGAGTLHNCLFRASRDGVAGPTRELAYLGLSSDLKLQGKTFICSLSPTVGKVVAALALQTLVLTHTSLLDARPWAAAITLVALGTTAYAVRKVSKASTYNLQTAE